MSQYVIGLDIGGTKTEACLLEIQESQGAGFQLVSFQDKKRYFRTLFRERVKTERHKGYNSVMEKVRDIATQAMSSVPHSKPVSVIGIGLPGAVHPQTHQMINGNTDVFVGQDLQKDFETMFESVPVKLANDANCFALAETLAGVGLEHSTVSGKGIHQMLTVGVILGTGCGTGVIYRGEMIEGRVGGTGEAGHSTLVSENGRNCFCGRKGCAELYVSGTGLQLTYAELSGGEAKSASEIFQLAEAGDALSKKTVVTYCSDLAKFLSNLTNVIDPDFFVLGGGVSQAELVYKGLESSIGGDLFLPVPSPKVYQNKLGDSAGSLGAAFLALSTKFDSIVR